LLLNEHVAPQTDTEKELARIWEELLGLAADEVSATANFFTSGGHSLLAIRLVAEVRKRFNVELSIKDLFMTESLSALGEMIDGLGKQRNSGQREWNFIQKWRRARKS
jgi:acyl carrier protein